jgi:guanosine-3',5'-bis(diphosphate) 3'-pyrophosphohydrolase
MKNPHLWQEAASFAARAHRHQLRKDGVTPYVAHPMRVAMTVACVFGFDDEHVLAAALLHDTIEDTGVDYDEVAEAFGRDVADMVVAMTKDMRLPEVRREKAYDEQLARGPWQGRLLKLADVYDNLVSTWDARSRRKQLGKAERALKLTARDKPLAEARRILRALVRKMAKSK